MRALAEAAWGWALCVAILSAFSAPVSAAGEDDPTVEFLQQVQRAAHTLDYSGVYVYQQGDQLRAARLVHLVDGKGEHQRLQLLDGPEQECLVEARQEQCLDPARKVVRLQSNWRDYFPAFVRSNARGLQRYYEWQSTRRHSRVAGRPCAVSVLQARDPLRYSYRLCTDVQNHLLLKLQTLDTRGKLIDQLSFASIRFGPDVAPEEIRSSWDTEGWTHEKLESKPAHLAAQGWRFALPAGFLPIAERRGPLGGAKDVDQLVLSDGLATISIFIETFDPNGDQTLMQGSLSQGAVQVYRQRLAAYWLTVVGEVPAQTVRDLAAAVQYLPHSDQ